jgi:hypothetical protein
MEPIDTHSPHRHRATFSSRRAILLAIAIGVPLVACCGWPAYMMYGILQGPYIDYTIWQYDDFQFSGGRAEVHSMRIKGRLPPYLEVEVREGKRFKLASISWEALVITPEDEASLVHLRDGDVFMKLGDTTYCCDVRFHHKEVEELTVFGHSTIHNMSNGQSVALPAKWSEIERVFGRPRDKKSGRSYVGTAS